MKPFASLFMSIVLTTAMLTGCGCTNRNGNITTPSTIQPTSQATTMPSTAPTETTAASTSTPTQSSEETAIHGNGPLVGEGTTATDSTTEPTIQDRARRNMPIQ